MNGMYLVAINLYFPVANQPDRVLYPEVSIRPVHYNLFISHAWLKSLSSIWNNTVYFKVILFQMVTWLFFLCFIVGASIIWKFSFAHGIWSTDKQFELAVITQMWIVEKELDPRSVKQLDRANIGRSFLSYF